MDEDTRLPRHGDDVVSGSLAGEKGRRAMTSENRARMREVLRAAVGKALLPGAELTHPGRFTPPPTPAYDLVERFRTELTKLGGNVHDARSVADVADIIVGRLANVMSPKVMMWDERHLPIAGLADELRAHGATILTQSPETADDSAHRHLLETSTVGVTGADGGLALTGSIVLASGPGRGRLASLLPPIHVALLKRSLMVESLPVFIGQHPATVTAGANFVCITGPSRTADIEHVLARGVHGPKEIHVILVD
jgi:L-lactate utilization protein LutC